MTVPHQPRNAFPEYFLDRCSGCSDFSSATPNALDCTQRVRFLLVVQMACDPWVPSPSPVLQNRPLFCKFLILVSVLMVFYFMSVSFDYVNHGVSADFLLSPTN